MEPATPKFLTLFKKPTIRFSGPNDRNNSGPSFPSGHVTASTAFFALLVFANWRIGLGCLAIPILIGFSRIYGGAHYLSDVICAAILGILCALLVWRFVLGKIENRQSAIEN